MIRPSSTGTPDPIDMAVRGSEVRGLAVVSASRAKVRLIISHKRYEHRYTLTFAEARRLASYLHDAADEAQASTEGGRPDA